jgi:pimeloyl-ACP methyl ester carboxylesterase
MVSQIQVNKISEVSSPQVALHSTPHVTPTPLDLSPDDYDTMKQCLVEDGISVEGSSTSTTPTIAIHAKNAIKIPQRQFEGLIGTALFTTLGPILQKQQMKKSKLIEKQVYLPKSNYTMHYLEREAVLDIPKQRNTMMSCINTDYRDQQPTIILFHGIGEKAESFAAFVNKLDIPSNIRILIPEQAGHGKDVDRAIKEGNEYEQPTHQSMISTTSEWLDEVQTSNNCNVFGISMGGGVAYYIHRHRPDKIQKAVLVSPAIPCCVDKKLVEGIQDGSNNFFCFESRQDVKLLMRDLSTGRNDGTRKKKDPIPKFAYEAVYRMHKKNSPEGHYKGLLMNILPTEEEEEGNIFTATSDIHTDATRLIIWPEKDQIINCERGKAFFKETTSSDEENKTEFETIPDCGHVWHSDGRIITDLIQARTREYLLEFK